MSRHLVEKPWASRNLYIEQGELLLLLEEPNKPLVTARTRHGRNIRVPLSILSRETVEFNCQLCGHPPFPDYTTYTSHLIEVHFRDQLVAGLDNTGCRGGMPSCPFPVCSGTLWASLEALLMHYASHHHVLEKLMMFECEQKSLQYRSNIQSCEERILEMKVLNSDLQKQLEQVHQRLREKAEAELLATTPDLKTMIKQENAALTSIENQTLKVEFLQLKLDKEKLEKLSEIRGKELEDCQSEMKNTTEEQKKTVDMCKQWKEVCLEEAAKHEKEVESIKSELSAYKKETLNLKNIIEIGKATVEHAKQLSIDLAKDNKKRQLKEEEYELHSASHKDKIKALEAETLKYKHEVDNLSSIVRFQHGEMDTKAKDDHQLYEDYKDMSSKYQSLIEVVKQKDVEIEKFKASLLAETECKVGMENSLKKALYEKQVVEDKGRREADKVNAKLESANKVQQENLFRTTKDLEEKKRELRSVFSDLEKTREKNEKMESELEGLQESEQMIKQELERVGKQLDGHKNLKTLYDNLQKKLQEERDSRETEVEEFKASREHFEEQTTMLLGDMDNIKAELQQARLDQEETKERMKDRDVDLRLKSNYISQLLEDSKANKSRLERFDEISARLNAKARQEEDLKKKCEKMTAELKVQGWEIDNYKNKLISFEMIVADLKELESCKVGVSPPSATNIGLMILNSNNNLSSANGGGEKEGWETTTDAEKEGWAATTDKDGCQPEYCENQEGVVDSSEVKIEINDDVDEKDITPQQRDGNSSKRDAESQDLCPENKKLKR